MITVSVPACQTLLASAAIVVRKDTTVTQIACVSSASVLYLGDVIMQKLIWFLFIVFVLKLDKHFRSIAAETLIKFQNNMILLKYSFLIQYFVSCYDCRKKSLDHLITVEIEIIEKEVFSLVV